MFYEEPYYDTADDMMPRFDDPYASFDDDLLDDEYYDEADLLDDLNEDFDEDFDDLDEEDEYLYDDEYYEDFDGVF